jgi:single-strand DNA-binding protein
MLGVTGSISTGSYEKDGRKVYTTEVAVARVEFLSKAEKKADSANEPPEGFSHADDIPFE